MKSISEILDILPAEMNIESLRNLPDEERVRIKDKIGRDMIKLINKMTEAFGDKNQHKQEGIAALAIMLENEYLDIIEMKWKMLQEIKLFNFSPLAISSSSSKHDHNVEIAVDLMNQAIITARIFKDSPDKSYYQDKKKLELEEKKAVETNDSKLKQHIQKELIKRNKAINAGRLLSGSTLTSSMRRLKITKTMLNEIYAAVPKIISNYNVGTPMSLEQQIIGLRRDYEEFQNHYHFHVGDWYENHSKNMLLVTQCEDKAKQIIRTLLDAVEFVLPFLAYGITPSLFDIIKKKTESLVQTFSETLDQPILNEQVYQEIINEFQKKYLELTKEIEICKQRPEEVQYRKLEKQAAQEGEKQFATYKYRMKLINSQNHFVNAQRIFSEKVGELQNKNKFVFYGEKNSVPMEKDTQRDLKIAGASLRNAEPEELLALLALEIDPNENLKVDKKVDKIDPLSLIADYSKEVLSTEKLEQDLIDVLDAQFGEENRINIRRHYDQGPSLLITAAVEDGLRSQNFDPTEDVPLIIRPSKETTQNMYMINDVVFRDAAADYVNISVADDALDNLWKFKARIKILLWVTKDGYVVEGMVTDSALLCNAIMQKNTHENLKNIVTAIKEFDVSIEKAIEALINNAKKSNNKNDIYQNQAKLAIVHSLKTQVLNFKQGRQTFDELIENIGAIHKQSRAFDSETLQDALISTLSQEANEIASDINKHFKILSRIRDDIEKQAEKSLNKTFMSSAVLQNSPPSAAASSSSSSASSSSASSPTMIDESKSKVSLDPELPLKTTINYLAAFRLPSLESYQAVLQTKNPSSQQLAKYNVISQNINQFRTAYIKALNIIVLAAHAELKKQYRVDKGKDKVINRVPPDVLVPLFEEQIKKIIDQSVNIDVEVLSSNLNAILPIAFPENVAMMSSPEEANLSVLGQALHILSLEKKAQKKLQAASGVDSSSTQGIKDAHLDWFIHKIELIGFWYRFEKSSKHNNTFSKILSELNEIKNNESNLEEKFINFALKIKVYWDEGVRKYSKSKTKDSDLIGLLNKNPNEHSFLRQIGVLIQDFMSMYEDSSVNKYQSLPVQLRKFPNLDSLLLPNREIILPKFAASRGELLLTSLSQEIDKFDNPQSLIVHLKQLKTKLLDYVDSGIYKPLQAFMELITEIKRIHLQGVFEHKTMWWKHAEFKDINTLAELKFLLEKIESDSLPIPKVPKVSSLSQSSSSGPIPKIHSDPNTFFSTSSASSIGATGSSVRASSLAASSVSPSFVSASIIISPEDFDKVLSDIIQTYSDKVFESLEEKLSLPDKVKDEKLSKLQQILESNSQLTSEKDLGAARKKISEILDMNNGNKCIPDAHVTQLKDIRKIIDDLKNTNKPALKL